MQLTLTSRRGSIEVNATHEGKPAGCIRLELITSYDAKLRQLEVPERYKASGVDAKLLNKARQRLYYLGFRTIHVEPVEAPLLAVVEKVFKRSSARYYQANVEVGYEQAQQLVGRQPIRAEAYVR